MPNATTRNLELFQMLPPLTTVVQPMRLIGENAAKMILNKIKDKALGKNKSYTVVLPTRLADNGTCATLDDNGRG